MLEKTILNKRIDEWVDRHSEEMLEDLKTLVRIRSVKGKPQAGRPYGLECFRAIIAMKRLMERYGIRATEYENYCVAGDLDAKGEKKLDILAHLDVVPVSDKWTKTSPFEPLIEGDRIYGRGTQDDKGPAVAALYAMRCIRELGIELSHGVRLICGADEECGSTDLDYYYSKEPEAEFTFSPDADYPLINVEKGRLAKSFCASGRLADQALSPHSGGKQDQQTESLYAEGRQGHPLSGFSEGKKGEVLSGTEACVHVLGIDVGEIQNVIPGNGSMVLRGASEKNLQGAADAVKKKAKCSFFWSEPDENGVSIIEVCGETGHAAFPENAVNCVTLILEFLKNLPLAEGCGEKMLLQAGEMWPYGDHYGAGLGVDCSDKESGRLTMSLDVLKYDIINDGTGFLLRGTFDCRAPICCNDENLTEKVRERLEEAGFKMEDGPMTPSHYVSADSELVRKLLQSYELYFEKKGEALVSGGGTYVHRLERGVAFGCEVEGVDNRIHGDDEFAQISVLIKSVKIFADAILRLCG